MADYSNFCRRNGSDRGFPPRFAGEELLRACSNQNRLRTIPRSDEMQKTRGTNRPPAQKYAKNCRKPCCARKNFPRRIARCRAFHPVKKNFQGIMRAGQPRVFRVKTMHALYFSADVVARRSRRFLSTKKITQSLQEKIDGAMNGTISSGLGFWYPHPVVVSNV